MSRYPYEPLDFTNLVTYPLADRKSKVSVADLARPLRENSSLREFFERLPNILAVRDLKAVATAVRTAREQGKAVIAGMGGHVIKCGLAPVLIDLMQRGFITAFALNGSGTVHDFEIALVGSTSEDVDATLGSGAFGGAEETGRLINQGIRAAAADGIGGGEGISRELLKLEPPFADRSLLCMSYQNRVPVTVHVAVGTDITHIHPGADGPSIGAASYHDFRLFCSVVKGLNEGGVYLNFGSAVILPEVFLKAVTTLRNLGHELEQFTTVNFDFMQHYRPLTNVVRRPVAGGLGKGYALTGHHELMIPLLAAAILEGVS
ncbi:MAG: hypothetical protein K1Y36_23860 [Blastocatellia bacterium]|nr:hypothetical protein [Blastocatellia bacterium]